MTKTYISNTEVSFNVCVAGEWTHVSFVPLTLGGSYLTTADTLLQEAIEHHRFFGSLVGLKPVDDTPPIPAHEETINHDDVKTISFTSFNDARDWTANTTGVSRSKLRSIDDIVREARKYGWELIIDIPGTKPP